MKLDFYYSSGAYNFQVTSRFLENLCTSALDPPHTQMDLAHEFISCFCQSLWAACFLLPRKLMCPKWFLPFRLFNENFIWSFPVDSAWQLPHPTKLTHLPLVILNIHDEDYKLLIFSPNNFPRFLLFSLLISNNFLSPFSYTLIPRFISFKARNHVWDQYTSAS